MFGFRADFTGRGAEIFNAEAGRICPERRAFDLMRTGSGFKQTGVWSGMIRYNEIKALPQEEQNARLLQHFDNWPARFTLAERVCNAVNEAILHLDILPGEKISEEKLASVFGISRTPVREGLRRLQDMGLVKISPNRGAEVVTFSDQEIQKLGLVRIPMDMVAAQQAMYYSGMADFDELDQLCDACDEAVQKGDLFGRVQWDSAFHLKIVELSRNELLLKYQKENYLRLQYMGIIQFTKDRDSHEMVSLHREIVAAMRVRDEKRICHAIYNHSAPFHRLENIAPGWFKTSFE